jgi:hypothetical protein
MAIKWSYFLAACVLAWTVLLTHGAPLLPIAIGTVAAAFWTARPKTS